MNEFIEILGNALLLLGSLLILTSAIGMNRMKDFFTRAHPAGINDSLSLPLILIGILLKIEPSLLMAKFILIIIFSMITTSTATHALTKSAILDLKPRGKCDKDYAKKIEIINKNNREK